jgi:hypothetical protein
MEKVVCYWLCEVTFFLDLKSEELDPAADHFEMSWMTVCIVPLYGSRRLKDFPVTTELGRKSSNAASYTAC